MNAALVDDLLKLKRQKAELERQIDELQRLFIEGASDSLPVPASRLIVYDESAFTWRYNSIPMHTYL